MRSSSSSALSGGRAARGRATPRAARRAPKPPSLLLSTRPLLRPPRAAGGLDVRAIGFRFGDDDDDDDELSGRRPRSRGDDDSADADDDRAAALAAARRAPSPSPDAPSDSPDGRPLPPIVPRLSQSSNLRAQSLLVLSPVLRSGPVGEAFSSLLATATRYQAKNSEIAREYARLYGAMLATGASSWPDYLVDQILAGRDNPIARAAAQGQLDFDDAPALRALAADLDALQELAPPLRQVAAYVGDVAPTVPARWVAAAGSAPSARRLPAEGVAGAGAAAGAGAGAAGAGGPAAGAIDVKARSRFVRPPPTEAELGAWRAAVQGHARWSQAVPLLQAYWHLHGFGVTSRASALRWSAGGLEEAPGAAGGAAAAIAAAVGGGGGGGGNDDGGSSGATKTTTTTTAATGGPLAAMDAVALSLHAPVREAVERNLARHAAGLPDAPARPLLLAGPPGSGKSWLLREAALRSSAVTRGGVRVVDVGPAELPNLLEAARGCGRYPRVRFVLLADDVPLPLAGGGGGAAWASDLLAALASAGGSAAAGGAGSAAWWPANVTLHVAASASSAVGWGDPLAQRCGEVLALPPAGEEGFVRALGELLSAAASAAAAAAGAGGGGEAPAALDEARAVAWAKERGALSVRGAVAYARELVAEAAYARAVKDGRAF